MTLEKGRNRLLTFHKYSCLELMNNRYQTKSANEFHGACGKKSSVKSKVYKSDCRRESISNSHFSFLFLRRELMNYQTTNENGFLCVWTKNQTNSYVCVNEKTVNKSVLKIYIHWVSISMIYFYLSHPNKELKTHLTKERWRWNLTFVFKKDSSSG